MQRLILRNNSLSGPAFPPAWLQPGTLPQLGEYDLSGNPLLAGLLPANLSWPSLSTL